MEKYDAEARHARGGHVDIRKLKRKPEANLLSLSKARLEALIEEAVVDAYGDEEQTLSLIHIYLCGKVRNGRKIGQGFNSGRAGFEGCEYKCS